LGVGSSPRDETWLGYRTSEAPLPSLRHLASHIAIGQLGSAEVYQHVDTVVNATRRTGTLKLHSALSHKDAKEDQKHLN
jgi:DNA-binding transcriptional regulator YhcF (GntR family)